MADNKTLRPYRGNDPSPRGNAPASDPLAELARLIGQSDPFAELGRSHARAAPSGRPEAAEPAADEWRYTKPPPQLYAADGSRAAPRDSHEQMADMLDPAPRRGRHDAGLGARSGRDSYPQSELPEAAFAPDPRYATDPGYAPDARYPTDPQFGSEPSYASDPRYSEHGQYGYDRDDEYDEQEGGRAQQHVHQHAHAPRRAALQQETDVDYYDEEDVPLAPEEDASYDDAPRMRKRSGLVTAVVLIGCAALGTVAAYAYRSYSSPAGSAQHSPPIITADQATPTKVVPAASGDSKSTRDRTAAAAGEQLVSKQEEPVALRELGTQSAPRVVLPAPVPPAQTGSAAGGPNSSEPKRVRTVTIRPDGADLSGRPVGTLPPAAAPARQAAPAPSAPVNTPPAPRASAPAPRGGTAPISLEPNEPAAPPRGRTAALPPASPAHEPSGAFVVQLSSQRSEAEAQAAFRSLQAKFPNELGGRHPIIKRADLGSKGVYYRTMVGPFSSSREASQFCSNYKSAGGQCVVPTN
jgi:hypothetical protein